MDLIDLLAKISLSNFLSNPNLQVAHGREHAHAAIVSQRPKFPAEYAGFLPNSEEILFTDRLVNRFRLYLDAI